MPTYQEIHFGNVVHNKPARACVHRLRIACDQVLMIKATVAQEEEETEETNFCSPGDSAAAHLLKLFHIL